MDALGEDMVVVTLRLVVASAGRYYFSRYIFPFFFEALEYKLKVYIFSFEDLRIQAEGVYL